MPFCYSVVEEVLSFSLAIHRQYQIDDKRTSKSFPQFLSTLTVHAKAKYKNL
ncbi:hypothetical protein Plhal304r1_c101g0175081 [Plasmopara halstedii]